jgi:membrane-bound lytic murein transglycosylase A
MLLAMRAEEWSAAWPAFAQTCRALGKRDAWRDPCTHAERVDPGNGRQVQSFFAARFDAYRVLARRLEGTKELDTRDTGLMTGYYEPLLRGSRSRSVNRCRFTAKRGFW